MMVIILDDIEYASGGGKSKENQAAAGQQNAAPQNTAQQNAASAPATGAEASGNLLDMKHLAADHSLMRIDWSNN